MFATEVYSASQTVKGRARVEKSVTGLKLFINTGLGGTALSNFLKWQELSMIFNMIKRAKSFPVRKEHISPETSILFFLEYF